MFIYVRLYLTQVIFIWDWFFRNSMILKIILRVFAIVLDLPTKLKLILYFNLVLIKTVTNIFL